MPLNLARMWSACLIGAFLLSGAEMDPDLRAESPQIIAPDTSPERAILAQGTSESGVPAHQGESSLENDANRRDIGAASRPIADVTGVVVDDGEAVAGAIVRVWYMGWVGRGWRAYTTDETTTDANGRFTLTMPRRRLSGIRVIARTADSKRMALAQIHPSSDPDKAVERSGLEDPVRLPRFELNLVPSVARQIRVVDSRGEPLQAANVGVFLFGEWAFATVKTEASGAAVIRIPAACNYHEIFAWKPGFGLDSSLTGEARPRDVQNLPIDNETLPITFTLGETSTIFIRAVDAITKRPVQDVVVTAEIPPKPKQRPSYAGARLGYGLSAATNADGLAEIDWLPSWTADETVRLWGTHPSYEAVKITLSSSEEDLPTVMMHPHVRLHGRVIFPDGSAAAGIVVESSNVARGNYQNRARTDEGGWYELSAPPDLGVVVSVVDNTWGAEPRTRFIMQPEQAWADVPDMVLQRATRVCGQVTAEGGDRPVAGQEISLHLFGPSGARAIHTAPHATRTTWTDEMGRYEFHVGPGTYTIQGPKDLESAGEILFARGYGHWPLNVPANLESHEHDFSRPIWKEEP